MIFHDKNYTKFADRLNVNKVKNYVDCLKTLNIETQRLVPSLINVRNNNVTNSHHRPAARPTKLCNSSRIHNNLDWFQQRRTASSIR